MSPLAGSSGLESRPHKIPRRMGPDMAVGSSPARSTMDLSHFVTEQQTAGHSTIAWSCTNLMASPAPAAPPTSSLLGPLDSNTSGIGPPPSIIMTYLSGTPTASRSRLSFTVSLPPATIAGSAASAASITHLSFSPCGAYLLVVCSHDSAETVTVLEQQGGCINQWEPVWCERVARFTGEDNGGLGPSTSTQGQPSLLSADPRRVVGSRWLGEPRRWYPSPENLASVDPAAASRPLYCAPLRSPPLVGAAFVAILSSNELLFVHLPRSSPLVPFTLVLPLQPPPSDVRLTLTARQTASTLAAQPLGTHVNGVSAASGLAARSPHNPLDALVANLVDGMPTNGPSPGAVVGALGLGGNPGATPESVHATVGEAMKQELKAAEVAKEAAAGNSINGRKLRVRQAAVGIARAKETPDFGVTLMLVATASSLKGRPPPVPPTPVVPAAVIVAAANLGLPSFATGNVMARSNSATLNGHLHHSAMSSPGDFSTDFADFSALDEAFGGGASSYKVESTPAMGQKVEDDRDDGDHESEQSRYASGDDGEKRIELSEIRIELMCQDGPRLTVRPLAPIYLSDGVDPDGVAAGSLTHLEWLEDTILCPTRIEAGTEAAVDLRLLAVGATAIDDTRLSSHITSWTMMNEPYELSEAFAGLDCKKGQAKAGEREWSSRRTASRHLEVLVTSVLPRAGSSFDSFAIIEAEHAAAGLMCRVRLLRSSTLEAIAGADPVTLPGNIPYHQAAVSPNQGLVGAQSLYTLDTKSLVSLAGVPSPGNVSWSTRLAQAIAQQVDFSDLLGRIIGIGNDVQTLAIVRELQGHLQNMLPSGRKLEQSGLIFELLGTVTTLFTASPNLQLRGSVAADFLGLAAVVRAFNHNERKERSATSDAVYRCESDAVWPLIAHALWYCDFSRNLAKECASTSNPSGTIGSPRHILVLHPLARSLLFQAAESILGLQAFLATFPMHQNFTVDTAKTVLDDVVDHNGLVLAEWRAVLNKIGETEDVTDSPALRELLVTFDLVSPQFEKSIATTSALLASSALFLPAELPTPPATPQASSNLSPHPGGSAHASHDLSVLQTPSSALDIIRRNRLAEKGLFQRCTRCGERAERRVLLGSETGKWSAYEIGWEHKCMCGGLWYADDVL